MAIEAISGALPAVGTVGPKPDASTAVSGFGDSFSKILEAANTSDQGADTAVGRMLDGSGDVHEAMIALQQADLMLQFTVQVRNKLVQAYQEIMRMPV
jgi:flagellar hook-basal body complex protein FliE